MGQNRPPRKVGMNRHFQASEPTAHLMLVVWYVLVAKVVFAMDCTDFYVQIVQIF